MKLSKFLNHRSVPWLIGAVIVVCVAFLLAWPMLRLGWDVVDDGVSLAGSHLIENAITYKNHTIAKPLFLEYRFVRFRPIFWLWFWSMFHFFETNALFFHLIRLGMFITSGLLVYGILGVITKSVRAAVLATLLYLTQPQDILNWYFLGHHEPLINFFWLLSCFLFLLYFNLQLKGGVKKWFYAGILLSVPLFVWSKEPSVVLLGPIGLQLIFEYFQPKKKSRFRAWLSYFLVTALCCGIMIGTLKYLSLNEDDGYFSMYKVVSQHDLWHMMTIYRRHLWENFSLLYVLPFITFIFSWTKNHGLTRFRMWQIFFLLSHVGFLVILIPFSLKTESYYLSTSYLFYCLFLGTELFRYFRSQSKWLPLVVMGAIGLLMGRNLLTIHSLVTEYMAVHQTNSQMMEKVVSLTATHPKVLFNFTETDRGYINGIKIQRASIFPCSAPVVDPEIIYGEANFCPDQVFEHVRNSQDRPSLTNYQLVVAGDLGRGQVMYPMSELLSTPSAQLKLVATISGQARFLDRTQTPDKLIWRNFKTQVKAILKDRKWYAFPSLPTQEIKPRWELYEVQSTAVGDATP